MHFGRVIVQLAACSCLLLMPVARAQFAVIDVSAIAQLVQQVQTLQSQLDTARAHLAAAQAQYNALSGDRGMARLLPGIQRNYLPTTWNDLQAVSQSGGAGYPGLSATVNAAFSANTVLSAAQLATFPAAVRQQVDTERRLTALSQGVTRQALATTSARFSSLQQLIDTLGVSSDPKAVLDLQARIQAENSMLQNEQSKLQTLHQLLAAESRANQQQQWEQALSGHGQFSGRFQPVP